VAESTNEKSNSSEWMKYTSFALVVLGTAAGLWYIWQPDDPLAEGSVRQLRMEQLTKQIAPTDQQRLMWAPWLLSEAYDVGTIFPMDGFGQAFSAACDNLTVRDVEMSLSLGGAQAFDLSANLDLAEQVGVEATGLRSVAHQMTVNSAKLAPGFEDMQRELYNDPDCLAAIASRPVLVLFARYVGDETYSFKRSAGGGVSLDGVLAAMGIGAGSEVEAEGSDDVTRKASTLIWGLAQIELNEPAIGDPEQMLSSDTADPTQLMSLREQVAEDLITTESDYAVRAIGRTNITAPSDDTLKSLIMTLSEAAVDES